MHVIKHFLTITRHRHAVMRNCFKTGLIWQGLIHDLSKYSPSEFWPGAKYYQGNRSPQAREREIFGYSAAWLHHKGRNKHHFEYWVDSSASSPVYVEMPAKYFAEMVCDRVAASKIYLKDKYTNASPLAYFENSTDKSGMNVKTCNLLRFYLEMLRDKGEKYMFRQLKMFVKKSKKEDKIAKKADKKSKK